MSMGSPAGFCTAPAPPNGPPPNSILDPCLNETLYDDVKLPNPVPLPLKIK